jgi:hypothetical protein
VDGRLQLLRLRSLHSFAASLKPVMQECDSKCHPNCYIIIYKFRMLS